MPVLPVARAWIEDVKVIKMAAGWRVEATQHLCALPGLVKACRPAGGSAQGGVAQPFKWIWCPSWEPIQSIQVLFHEPEWPIRFLCCWSQLVTAGGLLLVAEWTQGGQSLTEKEVWEEERWTPLSHRPHRIPRWQRHCLADITASCFNPAFFHLEGPWLVQPAG